MTTPSSTTFFLLLLLFEIGRGGLSSLSAIELSASTLGRGWGARISGTGPEKSFPVIRERVSMSEK